jgi:hypothetical protein
MGVLRPSSAGLSEKYGCILAQERAWAMATAGSMVRPKPISVWEVLIPILLIFSYMKSKAEKEVLVQNLLFTKEQALKAALGMEKNGLSQREALLPIEDKTRELLTSVQDGIYSKEIRQCQLKEIRLLLGHYRKLLAAEGEDYSDLTRKAYPGLKAYLDFLDLLGREEREVNVAALNTLGAKGNADLVSRMEASLAELRKNFALKIFTEVS